MWVFPRRNGDRSTICTKTAGQGWCLDMSSSSNSVAQLAIGVVSPAGHSPVVKDGTGVGASRRDCNCSTICTKTRGLGRCISLNISSISNLASPIVTPTGLTFPSSRIAQVWEPPEEIATAVRFAPRLLVKVGVFLFAVPPLPRWPLLPYPQQETEPSSRMSASMIMASRDCDRSTICTKTAG